MVLKWRIGEKAKEAVENNPKIKFNDNMEKIYLIDANVKDWCISRQICEA